MFENQCTNLIHFIFIKNNEKITFNNHFLKQMHFQTKIIYDFDGINDTLLNKVTR